MSLVEIQLDPARVVVDVMRKFDVSLKKAATAVKDGIATDLERRRKYTMYEGLGNLAKGMKVRKSKFPNGGYIIISTAPHTHLVEFGGRYLRFAKRSRAMAFRDSQGRLIVRRIVDKMPKRPFMRPGLRKRRGLIYNILDHGVV
jgi:hypothetical protein